MDTNRHLPNAFKAMATGKGRDVVTDDPDCICKGNWRAIVRNDEERIGRRFNDNKGEFFTFFGIVYGGDDYYYGMSNAKQGVLLLSCVGSIESHGFEEVLL